jgi:hypothetical protein
MRTIQQGDARIVLTTLIDEKLLTPGPKKLYVFYYYTRVYADLLPDGSIRYKDQVYTSPVPCALHMKRTLNPCTCRPVPMAPGPIELIPPPSVYT